MDENRINLPILGGSVELQESKQYEQGWSNVFLY